MKKHIVTLIPALLLTSFVLHGSSHTSFGKLTRINDNWRFALDLPGDYSAPGIDDSSWRMLDLPHDWSIEGAASPDLASCTGYLPGGIGWYRRPLEIPKSEEGRKQFLYFCGVYCNGEVWINGHRLGIRPHGYVSFMYDITPYVQYGGDNTIAVRVDHSKSADSRWYTGSGIYRDVYLVSSDPVHIDLWGIFAYTDDISGGRARIGVDTKVVNESSAASTVTLRHSLFTKDGKKALATVSEEVTVPAGGSVKNLQKIGVDDPLLWSVDHPNLYRIETSVLTGGKQIDGTTTVTGIRNIRFDPNEGFFLNGKNMKIKGVCLHHDAGALGAAVPKRVLERRLQSLREIGCNAIRMSHNPQARELYELCDEMGFLVMDEAFDEWEFPKRKWIEGWNVGKNPGHQGYSEYFHEWAERDLADMVMRDRNHPSIIMWSVGNEVDYPNDPYSHPILDHEGINQKTIPGYKPERPHAEQYGRIAVNLVKLVKDIDTTRAVTGALAGVVMSNHTDYPGALDVTGYNYTEHRYELDHATYPDRVIYGSENRHEYKHWQAVTDNDYISGQFLWTGIDYLGEAGRWPSRGFICGLLDLGGFMRPRGYYRQSLWSYQDMIYAGTYRKEQAMKKNQLFDAPPVWNYPTPGEEIRVVVFTNCEEAVLMLNGKPVGGAPGRDASSNGLYWDVPYQPGELKAIGLVDSEPYVEYVINTHGPAVAMKATADREKFSGRGDIVHLVIELQDEKGITALDARDILTCAIKGPGRLLSLENADSHHMDGFHGDSAPAFNGRMLAYIESTANSGTVEVSITADGFSPVVKKFKIKPAK